MQHVRFGRTGLTVSRLCLGTMTFGLQCDEEASRAVLDAAFDAGITLVDTADVYPGGGGLERVGQTEEIIGRWLAGHRDDIVLATKGHNPMGPQPWARGSSRKHLLEALEASLRRLRTDHVDLYQVHRPDPDTPIDETLGALDDMVRGGKVRYVGCSNFQAYQVARALGRSEALGRVRFDSVQPRYNLLFRQFERELFPLCAEEGLAVLPYNPIAGGMLTGKHTPGSPSAGTRFTLDGAGRNYRGRYWTDEAFSTVEALRPLACEAGITIAQLATAWVLANPVVTAPIVGATSPSQLDDAVRAVDFPLDPDLRRELDDLTVSYRRGDADR